MMLSAASGSSLLDLKHLLALAAEIADPKAVSAALEQITAAKSELDARFAALQDEQRALAKQASDLEGATAAYERAREEAVEAQSGADLAASAARAAKDALEASMETLAQEKANHQARVDAHTAGVAAFAVTAKNERESIAFEWKKVKAADDALQEARAGLAVAIAAHDEKVSALKSLMAQ